MKKSTVNTILLVGAAAAAWFIFTSMRKRGGSSVEAGSPIKQTESEFEADYAEVVKPADSTKPSVLDTVKNVLQVIKRSPEKKAAAQAKKATKKAAKLAKKKVAGFDSCSGLY